MTTFNPRTPWLALYVLANIVGALIIFSTGELLGDLAGVPLFSSTALFWSTTLVVLSYVILLGPVFKNLIKIRIKAINFGPQEALFENRLGVLLVVLQIAYLAFNLATGVNIAGAGNIRTDSAFSMFWVLIPVDALFFIYYGMHRESRYFYPNLAIWLVSNLLRGWSGIFLRLIFFEWCRAARNNNLKPMRVAIIGVFVIALYPLLANIKWIVRGAAGVDLSINQMIDAFGSLMSEQDYFLLIGDAVTRIIARIQVVSSAVEVIHLKELLSNEFLRGKFAPFWMEGMHGIAFDRLFLGEKTMSIDIAFTQYADFAWKFDVGDWNTNVSYVAWFFITPYLIPVYVLYTCCLIFFSIMLVKKIGISQLSNDMLWLVCLIYVMPPWLGTFVNFLYALCVFLALKFTLTRTPRISVL